MSSIWLTTRSTARAASSKFISTSVRSMLSTSCTKVCIKSEYRNIPIARIRATRKRTTSWNISKLRLYVACRRACCEVNGPLPKVCTRPEATATVKTTVTSCSPTKRRITLVSSHQDASPCTCSLSLSNLPNPRCSFTNSVRTTSLTFCFASRRIWREISPKWYEPCACTAPASQGFSSMSARQFSDALSPRPRWHLSLQGPVHSYPVPTRMPAHVSHHVGKTKTFFLISCARNMPSSLDVCGDAMARWSATPRISYDARASIAANT
mmetsp:Transcript_38000/g.104505  ORF Transcript_38000/g.104505 Transcript_38000/m.104505 type:complete len:267 (+) Transcript_38000:155-955(+)